MPRPRNPLADLPREVTVLVMVAVAVALGFGVVAPAIPLFAKSFGVGNAAAGAVVSIFAAARLLSAFGGGRLVDRFGERRVLATGIASVALSSALAGLAQSYVQLLVLRGLGGLGSALFTLSATSLLLRAVPARQRGRAQGLFQGGFLLGGIVGPAFGGIVTGISLRAPFLLYAATLAVAGGIGLALLPRHDPDGAALAAGGPQRTTLAQALAQPAYRAALAARFAHSWTTLGVRAALVPTFVVEVLHRGAGWVGAGFVITAALSGLLLLPAGRYADEKGRRPVILAGAVLSTLAMVVLTLPPSLAAYLVAMTLLGLGAGLLGPAPAAVVGDVVVGRGGTVVAVFQMAGDAGVVIGPLLAGYLADRYGFADAFAVTAAVLAVAVVMALRAPETLQAEDADDAVPAPG